MTQDKKYWLSQFHKGTKTIIRVESELKELRDNLNYTFPHIADDIQNIIMKLKYGLECVEEATNNSIDENIVDHTNFVDSILNSALNGLIKNLKDK